MHDPVLSIAASSAPLNLVDFIKPVLAIIPFFVYFRLASSNLEADARKLNLGVARWNVSFLVAGFAALAAVLFIPVFWAGWPLSILILAAPLLWYMKSRNDNVEDESQKFSLGSGNLGEKMANRKSRSTQRNAAAVLVDNHGIEQQVPEQDDPVREIHLLMEDLLLPAVDARATRVELAATSKGGNAAQIVDGVRYKRDPLPADSAASLIDYVKRASGVSTEEKRKKQRGSFELRLQESSRIVNIDLTTSGSSAGIVVRLDLNRTEQLDRDFESLGLETEQIEMLAPSIEIDKRHGVILVSTPPGRGLTTALYGLLQRHDAYTTNVKTLEREVERQIEGIDQTEWDPTNPALDFPTQLRSIIRRGPDIIMVSDLQDPVTAKQAALVGRDGPLLYQGVPSKDGVPGAITEWFRSVGDLKDAATPLTAVVAGRMLRKLCPECRVPAKPSSDQVKKFGIDPAKATIFRQSGRVQTKNNKIEECRVCRGTGFFGTVGVYEVMPVDREASKLLASGDLKAAYTHARRSLEMMLMQEAAVKKVARGETSFEEIARVFSPEKKPSKASPAAAN